MFISNLKIKNYRNFASFEIKLTPITLIIGENNVGKSNLLESVGLIFSQDVSFFKKRMLSVTDFNFDTINRLKQDILDFEILPENIVYPIITIEAWLQDWNSDQSSVIGDWFSNQDSDGNFTHAKLTYDFGPVANFDKTEEISAQRNFIKEYIAKHGQETFDLLSKREKHNLVGFPISKYFYSITGGNGGTSQVNYFHLNQLKFELLDALRDAERELSADGNGRLLFRVLNSKNENEYRELKSELVSLQQAVDNNPALNDIKQKIETQLEKISLQTANDSNQVDFFFSMPNVADILKKLSLLYGENATSIQHNGTGRNNLLYISLMLSYLEDSNYAKKVYWRIVGIEEPEAHLHPNLQNHLAQNFETLMKDVGTENTRKDLQTIITSHSTHVTTKLDFDNTVVLYKNGTTVVPHYILEGFEPVKSKELQYLKKYFDAINTNMFYSRKIILVEGISEQLLIPAFHMFLHKQTLEQKSTCIINVNGLAFRNFLEIIKNGYFLKSLVLTDSDTGTSVEGRADQLISDYAGVDQIKVAKTALSTFEKDLIDANKSEPNFTCLANVLKVVRPIAGKQYLDGLSNNEIGVDEYFALIEKHKSTFAFELMVALDSGDYANFTVPEYIEQGFAFLDS